MTENNISQEDYQKSLEYIRGDIHRCISRVSYNIGGLEADVEYLRKNIPRIIDILGKRKDSLDRLSDVLAVVCFMAWSVDHAEKALLETCSQVRAFTKAEC